jgi:hypothetical protein
MSVNRCIGSNPKLRRTGSIRGWGEHVATIGDEVVFNALEDDGVSGNWSCLLVFDDVHVNSCRLTIGVDIVCGGEILTDVVELQQWDYQCSVVVVNLHLPCADDVYLF